MHARLRAVARRLLIVAAAAIATLVALPASPASAHGQLVESAPVADSTVAEPVDAVALYFTEKPASNAHFTLTGPDGGRLDHGWYHGEPKRLDKPVQELFLVDGTWEPRLYHTGFPVRITVAHWPATGRYVARYLSVASDGEAVRGEVAFTYTGATTSKPSDWQPPTNEADPSLVAALGGTSAAPPTAAAPTAPTDGSSSVWVWAVPAVLVVGAGVLILRAARRPAATAVPKQRAGTRNERRKAAQQRHAAQKAKSRAS